MELPAWHFIGDVGQYTNVFTIKSLDGDFISWLFDYVGDEHFYDVFLVKQFLVYKFGIIKFTHGCLL